MDVRIHFLEIRQDGFPEMSTQHRIEPVAESPNGNRNTSGFYIGVDQIFHRLGSSLHQEGMDQFGSVPRVL